MLLLLVVGTIFLAIGAGTIFSYLRFKNQGKNIKGQVKCLEKYISTSGGHSTDKTRTTMYSAVVEYLYQGKTRLVKSIDTNQLRHQPGQQLNVLVIESDDGKIRAKIADSANYLLGSVFGLIGLIGVGIYAFNENGSLMISSMSILIALLLSAFFPVLIERFKLPYHSAEDNQFLRKNATIIETTAEYEAEVGRHYFSGKLLVLIFGLIGLCILVWGYSMTNSSQFVTGELQSLLSNPAILFEQIKSGNLAGKWHAPLILMGMGSFFILTSIYSYFYQKRKFGR